MPRPTGVRNSSQEVRDREAEVVRLRRQGMTFDDIADAVGFTNKGTAYTTWKNANARIIVEDVEEIRKLEGERLDTAQAAIWDDVLAGDVAAVNTLLRLMDRRSKLFGLDSPVRVQAEVTKLDSGANIDDEVARLAALLEASEE
jgi:DNA-binding CsgD family transcriptional regulator